MLTLEELWNVELSLLRRFDAFCRTHGLRYTLASGTLLGAVRHKGFIPWDDDIDLFMPRPDYERMVAVFGSEPPDDTMRLVYPGNGGEVPYAKIQDRRYRVKASNVVETCHCDDYLWIDIFPLDGLPRGRLRRGLKTLLLRSFNFLGNQIRLKNENIPGCRLRKKLGPLFKALFRWMPFSRLAKIAEACVAGERYETAVIVGPFSPVGYARKFRFTRAGFDEPVPLDFCGEKFPGPRNWDEILHKHYGDYMTLPPKGKRITHMLQVERTA